MQFLHHPPHQQYLMAIINVRSIYGEVQAISPCFCFRLLLLSSSNGIFLPNMYIRSMKLSSCHTPDGAFLLLANVNVKITLPVSTYFEHPEVSFLSPVELLLFLRYVESIYFDDSVITLHALHIAFLSFFIIVFHNKPSLSYCMLERVS